MELSTTAHLAPTDAMTAGQWLGTGSVYVHVPTATPDDADPWLSLSGAPDDLERLAAACIEAANLAREKGNAA